MTDIIDNLYCFISHREVIDTDKYIINNMMKNIGYDNYLIVVGGCSNAINIDIKNHILYLSCDDSYGGLPEKMNTLYKYINNRLNIKHITKLDRTVTINSIVTYDLIKDIDYGGRIIKFINHPKTSTYHFGKCEENSIWYNKPFTGPEIPYCLGDTYILSKKALRLLAEDNTFTSHIYEDYYVGTVLHNNQIIPKDINIRKYFYDFNHL